MKKHPSLSVVIPIYNNSQTLLQQLTSCLKQLERLECIYEVIVADDASTDDTPVILSTFKNRSEVILFRHKKNKGIAGNVKFLYGKAKYDTTLLFSIDGDWSPKDIPRLYTALSTFACDIVIGRRDKRAYSGTRRMISYFYNLIPLLFFGVDVIDAGSIKIFTRRVYKEQHFHSQGVFLEAEMLIRASKKGYILASIPVSFTRQLKTKGSGGSLKYILPAIYDAILLKIRGI